MPLKPQERLRIITEFIKTGVAREGYKITETKEGKYRVSIIRDEKAQLIKKRAKLARKIEEIDKALNPIEESVPEEATPEDA